MLNCRHHIQLGPDDSMSFLTVCDANKVHCSCSLDLFSMWYRKKGKKESELHAAHELWVGHPYCISYNLNTFIVLYRKSQIIRNRQSSF